MGNLLSFAIVVAVTFALTASIVLMVYAFAYGARRYRALDDEESDQ